MSQNKITVKLVKSTSGCTKKQAANVRGLGLRKINSTRELPDSKETHGMINKVSHLVKIQS